MTWRQEFQHYLIGFVFFALSSASFASSPCVDETDNTETGQKVWALSHVMDEIREFFRTDKSVHLTADQLLKINQLSSIFENGDPEFQYNYLEDIEDGAGITAGRIGFTTNAGDLLELVQRYLKIVPNSDLARYVPCLEKIKGTSEYACLYPSVSAAILKTQDFKSDLLLKYDFGKAFAKSSADPRMKATEDQLTRENVLQPTMEWIKKLGLKTPLGVGVIFDTVLQMGEEEDNPNAMGGLSRRTQKEFEKNHPNRKSPSNTREEVEWLKLFLKQRSATLQHPFKDDDTPGAPIPPNDYWMRCDSLLRILDSGNTSLKSPLHVEYFSDKFDL